MTIKDVHFEAANGRLGILTFPWLGLILVRVLIVYITASA